ncbi:DUF3046 domain-containing protein [Microbacterium flavum]|uniref:DUF3046 domain-containing protein n=1 Tax=Microbacterium flavum TaxID=415216 RepID=UPI0024ADA4CF|nr:DUF3046 domain-containing protein [Microbacterium flavum]
MRRSEFQRAVDAEFGVRAPFVIGDLILGGVGYRSARQALDEGVAPRDVWLALCAEMDVPESRRHGVGRMDPPRR